MWRHARGKCWNGLGTRVVSLPKLGSLKLAESLPEVERPAW